MATKRTKQKEIVKEIEFHYVENPSHHVFHINGAIGGLNPHNELFVSFYSERVPTPTLIVNELTELGVGNEVKRVSKNGIVREVEATLAMNLNVAKSIGYWLIKTVEDAEKLIQQPKDSLSKEE